MILSSLPFRNFILSALFVLLEMYEIPYLPYCYLSSSFLRTKISRKKNRTNFALGRINIFIEEKERIKEDLGGNMS